MKIGIDYDNTIVNTKEVSKKYLDIFLPNNNLENYHELPLDQELEFFKKYHLDITASSSVFEGFKELFNELKDKGITLALVTARGSDNPELIEPTKKFLEDNGIFFDEYIFSAGLKGQICKENNIDLLIDDSLSVIKNASSYTKVLLYGEKSEDYPYAMDWQEVKQYLYREVL